MRKILACFIPAVSAALLLGACAEGERIHYTHYGSYSGSIAHYGARNGEMALSVFGNPTDAGDAAFTASVAAALKGTHVNHDVVFVPTDPPQMDSYRTVAVFGGTTLQAICGPNPVAAGGAAPGGPGRMAAAYCYADDPLSFVSAEHGPVSGPDDPALRHLIRSVGQDLFPPENPDRRKGCDFAATLC